MEGMGRSCSTNFHMVTTTRSYTVPSTAGLLRFVVLRIEATAEVICVAGSEEYQGDGIDDTSHLSLSLSSSFEEHRGLMRHQMEATK